MVFMVPDGRSFLMKHPLPIISKKAYPWMDRQLNMELTHPKGRLQHEVIPNGHTREGGQKMKCFLLTHPKGRPRHEVFPVDTPVREAKT